MIYLGYRRVALKYFQLVLMYMTASLKSAEDPKERLWGGLTVNVAYHKVSR